MSVQEHKLRLVNLVYSGRYLCNIVSMDIIRHVVHNNQRTLQRVRNGLHRIRLDENIARL